MREMTRQGAGGVEGLSVGGLDRIGRMNCIWTLQPCVWDGMRERQAVEVHGIAARGSHSAARGPFKTSSWCRLAKPLHFVSLFLGHAMPTTLLIYIKC